MEYCFDRQMLIERLSLRILDLFECGPSFSEEGKYVSDVFFEIEGRDVEGKVSTVLSPVDDWSVESFTIKSIKIKQYNDTSETFIEEDELSLIQAEVEQIIKHVRPMHWFDDALPFAEGFAGVEKDNEWFFIDTDGNDAFNGRRFQEVRSFNEGLAAVKINDRWRYINTGGKDAFGNIDFSEAYLFDDGIGVVREDDQSLNFIDHEGKKREVYTSTAWAIVSISSSSNQSPSQASSRTICPDIM